MKPNVIEYEQYQNDLISRTPGMPALSPAKVSKLHDVENILEAKGLTWLTINPNNWLEIYEELGSTSTQRIALFDAGIREFYEWATEVGYIKRFESPYRKINASEVYNIGINAKYLSTLDELLEKIDKSQEKEYKLPKESKDLNKAYMCLLWYGLTENEMLELKSTSLYPDKEFVDEPILNLKTDKRVYRLSPSAGTRMLLEYQREARLAEANGEAESPAPLLIGYGAGKTKAGATIISEGSLTMRIKRTLERVNAIFGKDYTAKTIKQSGCYSRTYTYFKAHGTPFYYTDETANELLRRCGLRTEMRRCDKQKEFHKFIEYVKAIKNEDI